MSHRSLPSEVLRRAAEIGVSAARLCVRNLPFKRATWRLCTPLDTALGSSFRRIGTARTRHGATMRFDTKDLITRYIYLFGVWEPYTTKVLRLALQEGDVLLDIGAHVGYFSLLGAKLVGRTGRVISIEPNPAAVSELRANLVLNSCDNVEVVESAVHLNAQRARFWTAAPESNSGAATMMSGRRSTGEVGSTAFEADAMPLRSLVRAEVLASVKVVKIDVEGAEVTVLTSLLEILPEMRTDVLVLMELGRHTTRAEVTGLVQRMGLLGFTVYRLHNEYGVQSYPRMVSDKHVAMSEFDPDAARPVEVDLMFVSSSRSPWVSGVMR